MHRQKLLRLARKRPRVVAWGSWKEWDCVRAALFSSSPSRISAAVDRISAWQARTRIPVSVEITANLFSIQQRDPHFRKDIPSEWALPDELLRLMYSMSIMRLINGVVDDENSFRRGSVAFRALKAELPRLLVDIRHNSAHSELPGIALLRMASSQALEWLEVFYWQHQKAFLESARENLKHKVLDCVSLLQKTYIPYQSISDYDKQHFKKVKHDRSLAFGKLIAAALRSPQDFVSILIDDMLLEQSPDDPEEDQGPNTDDQSLASVEDLAWKYLISKLSTAIPQLLQMLVLGLVRRLTGLEAVADAAGHTFMHEGGDSVSKQVTRCTGAQASRLIDWLQWLLTFSSSSSKQQPPVRKAEHMILDLQLDCRRNGMEGRVSPQIHAELLSLSLKEKLLDRSLQLKLVKVASAAVGCTVKASRLAQLSNLSSSSSAVEEGGRLAEELVGSSLNRLESGLTETTTTQQQIISSGRLSSQDDDDGGRTKSVTGRRRRRWILAKNWKPCAVGMLPSSCYFGGARPSWLLDCVPELCSSSHIDKKLKRTAADAEGAAAEVVKVLVRDARDPSATSPADLMMITDDAAGDLLRSEVQLTKDDTADDDESMINEDNSAAADGDDDHQTDYHEKTVKSIKGCLLLNGRFQTVGPELLTALQREIRFL